jgi:hypothetical protein
VSFTPPKSYFLSLPKAKQIRRRQFKKKNKSYRKTGRKCFAGINDAGKLGENKK